MYARVYIHNHIGEPIAVVPCLSAHAVETVCARYEADSEVGSICVEYGDSGVGEIGPDHWLRAAFAEAAKGYAMRSQSAILEARGRTNSRLFEALLALQSRVWRT